MSTWRVDGIYKTKDLTYHTVSDVPSSQYKATLASNTLYHNHERTTQETKLFLPINAKWHVDVESH